MEHRKFLQRLDELVVELTHAQAQKVIAALQQRGEGDEVQRILEQRLEDDPKRPHCGSRGIEGWGRERNGLPRSRCLDRQRTFNLLTGTPLARLRKKERWLGFAGALNQSLPVRKAAKACNVNKNTAFKWRHRFLKAQNQSKDQTLAGIAEVDEIFFLESFKGQRKLLRAARKRGGVAEKPGLSAEQIPVLIARNRAGAISTRCCRTDPKRLSGRFLGVSYRRTIRCCAWMAIRRWSPSQRPKASNMSSSSPARVSMWMRRCCTSRTSMLMAGAGSNGSTATTASPPNICQATSAGGDGWKRARKS